MRRGIIALMLAWGSITAAPAQVSVGIGVSLPGVSIGIDIPAYPQLVRVPDYPVYYAPGLAANFFFYDGMYWVYESDNWYASSWYNGPWSVVGPAFVPVFVLRIPVRYYRSPPPYFRGWRPDAPPRWGERWGGDWEQQHRGWDRWNRRAAPVPAPLPVYQRRYTGDRYPRVEQQRSLESRNYRYQPRDPVVKQHFRQDAAPRGPANAPAQREFAPREQRPVPQGAPRSEAPAQRPAGPPERVPQSRAAAPEQAPHQAPARPEPPAARPAQRGPAPDAPAPQERAGRGQGQGQGQDRDRGEGRGPDRKN